MATPPSSEYLSSSELTQRSMLSDLAQQRWLIAVGVGLVLFLIVRMRREPPQERAARNLVREMRNVDDIWDARDLFGSNLPPIFRPAMLLILEELERQVKRGFRNMERSIQHL
ncbi:MAG TPA: hypothetical protein VFG86_03345 [Chloroflexota bacterium]|jgi:hypothetical protein|nr:hypothetical protein [Chloroflexota bacterium]